MNITHLILPASIILAAPSFAETPKKDFSHEIQYGIINLANFSFIDGDWSEIPVVGARYKYYFTPVIDNTQPYDLQAYLGRNNWLKVDLNALNFNPNLAGKYHFSKRWSVEVDMSYERYTNNYTHTNLDGQAANTKFEEHELLTDISVGYMLDKHWFLAIAAHNETEDSEWKDMVDNSTKNQHSYSESETFVAIKARYTNVVGGRGWDIDSSFSHHKKQNTAKLFATYFTNKHNSYKMGLVYSNETGYWNDRYLTASFTHQYWFSKSTAIKYGISWVRNEYDDGNDNSPLIDINGTWRF